MKYSFIAILFFLPILLCACHTANTTISESKEEYMEERSETYDSEIVIGPVMEPTSENRIKGVTDLYQNVCDSYAKMQELANDPSASKKGRKAASNVEEKYAKRIDELSELNFSQLSSDELSALLIELSDITAQIRNARDTLTLY